MATTTSTALEVIKPGGYLALNHSSDEMAEMLDVLAENLGGETLTARDLPRISMPAGGGLTWEMPLGNGDVEPVKTLTGIIVHFQRTHSYWPPSQAGGTPPICSSIGPEIRAIGVGDPGGPCKTCPHNLFATKVRDDGSEGDGKACTERENWFLLVEDRPLPIVVSLSPGSLNAAKEYRVDTLGAVGKRLSSVVTEIGLATTVNKAGQKFSYAVPREVGSLSPAEAKRARKYAIGLRPVFDATTAAVATEARVAPVADVDSTSADLDDLPFDA
jgi:hypothetical protein